MTPLLDIDEHAFADLYGRTPGSVRHHLVDHPLLTVESLAELAEDLPTELCEHNLGNISTVVPDAYAEIPRLQASPGEVARTIETNGSWMILRNIEHVPRYKDLLDACLDEVAPIAGRREGRMLRREGFVFLSAPNAVTPSHFDPEHNFLLQIRGVKSMNVGAFADEAMRHRELERFYGGSHSNMPIEPVDVTSYVLNPGEGVYVPPHDPHFVQNGPAVSVSLSITWRTPVTVRRSRAYEANARLRRLRVAPRPPGASPAGDRAKHAGMVATKVVTRGVSKARSLAPAKA